MPQCVSLIQSRREDVSQIQTNKNKWPRKTHSFFSLLPTTTYLWQGDRCVCVFVGGGEGGVVVVLEAQSADSQGGICQLPPCSCQPGAESEGGLG